MYAIRQIQQVVDGKIVVQLPDDFPATQVEVIVLPAKSENGIEYTALTPDEDQSDEAIQHFLALDISHFTEEQRKAYQRTCEILRKGRRPDEPRIFGAFEGLGWMADDFNTLPDEELALFYTDINITDHKNTGHQP